MVNLLVRKSHLRYRDHSRAGRVTLEASEHITANEIAAAGLADYDGVLNPQQQLLTWPDHPVVALALLDQLARGAADVETVKAASDAMEAARASLMLANQSTLCPLD